MHVHETTLDVERNQYCVCVCVCVREKEREGGGERERVHEHGPVLAYLSSMPYAATILSASSLAPPYFLTLFQKQHIWKNVTEHKMCFFQFSQHSSF
jgi:hypothetical protein